MVADPRTYTGEFPPGGPMTVDELSLGPAVTGPVGVGPEGEVDAQVGTRSAARRRG